MLPPAKFPGAALDGLYQQRHQSIMQTIHRAVDLAELRIALDRLQLLGLPKEQANALYAQADALHALLMTENNRAHVLPAVKGK